MIEVIRIVSAALVHATYGVNVQLETVPLAEEHRKPHPIVKFLDATEDDEVLVQPRPLDYPAIVTSIQTRAESDSEFGGVFRDWNSVEVFIDLIVGTADAFSARDVLYTLRAIVKCLHDLMDPVNTEDTQLNNICIFQINSIAIEPAALELPSGMIVGTVIPNFFVRDQQP